jgi:hypothetical protein
MTKNQVMIAVGVAAAVVAFGYLATKREVHATVEAGEASITYNVGGGGAAGAPSGQEDSHARMLRLIELSNEAIAADEASS